LVVAVVAAFVAPTAAGAPTATRVEDIHPGRPESYPDNLKALGGTLYFWAMDPVHGRELWKAVP
jgi:hypothetical protein